jgi:hypothetical protein
VDVERHPSPQDVEDSKFGGGGWQDEFGEIPCLGGSTGGEGGVGRVLGAWKIPLRQLGAEISTDF